MTSRNKSRGKSKAFVHPWRRYENEFRCWVYQEGRRKRIQRQIKGVKAICDEFAGCPAKAGELSRYRRRLEKLLAASQKIRQRTEKAIAAFYPVVLASAERIVRLPYFTWLQMSGADLVSEWIVDMAERNFRGYDLRRPFFCYGLFTLRRLCGNIARRESRRRCKAIHDNASCEDDPLLIVQLAAEFDEVYPLFCKLPPRVQEILVRKYCLEESSADIAGDLDTESAAIDRLTWRYRLKIRKQVAENRRRAA